MGTPQSDGPFERTRHQRSLVTSRSRWWAPRLVMWAAIALSVALFVLLVVQGWTDTSAASVAGGLLLIACVAVCAWAAAQGRRAEREVDRAIRQISGARRARNDRYG